MLRSAELDDRPVTPQAPFQIGSTDKSLTTLAIMQLVEVGKITFLEASQVFSLCEIVYLRVIPAGVLA
jgi:hypothetical protein